MYSSFCSFRHVAYTRVEAKNDNAHAGRVNNLVVFYLLIPLSAHGRCLLFIQSHKLFRTTANCIALRNVILYIVSGGSIIAPIWIFEVQDSLFVPVHHQQRLPVEVWFKALLFNERLVVTGNSYTHLPTIRDIFVSLSFVSLIDNVVIIIRIVILFCIISDVIYIVNIISIFCAWVATYVCVCVRVYVSARICNKKINSGQNSIFSCLVNNKIDHTVHFSFFYLLLFSNCITRD